MEIKARKKDSARLLWDTKPRRAINPKDIEFQTAEAVLRNPARDQQTIQSFFNIVVNIQIEKSKMNRLIWGNNLLAMKALLASGYEGKVNLIYMVDGILEQCRQATTRYERFGIIPNRGQWKWKKEGATRAIENYRKFENEFKNNLGTDQYKKLSKDELEFLKNKSLLEYWGSNGQTLLGPLNCVKY